MEPNSTSNNEPVKPESTVPNGGAVVGGSSQGQGSTPVSESASAPRSQNGKKKWLLPAGIAALAILLGGGYVFGMYLPNQPSAVYSKSLTNTGKAVDSLVDYSNNLSQKNYKSYAVAGTIKLTSGSGSFDGTLAGAFDLKANANLKLNLDAVGQKINAEVRSLHVNGNTSPDVYVQLTGIKPMLDGFGAGSLGSLDGQWIAIDHTVIDTYAANIQQSLTRNSPTNSVPTAAQIHDALTKVQTVNKQYLFTTDSSKAVLKQDKYFGKETKDSRSVYHYKVSTNKDHLKAYGEALKKALDSSSLNDWYKKANNGNNISAKMDFGSVSGAHSTITLDVWADAKTKLIHMVQFNDSSDPNSVMELSQNYTGGDEYPFDISVSNKSGNQTTKTDIKLSINKKSDKSTVGLTGNEGSTTYNLNFTITPGDNAVQVTAPSGAQPIVNILGKLGLTTGL